MGSIVTFYSYKGGVGRSMALANIAVLLARRGKKVLAVDWDLEAPGLPRYFAYLKLTQEALGLLPFLLRRRNGDSASDYKNYLSKVEDIQSGRSMDLLASGYESDPYYSTNLERFDWQEFFREGGGDFFENLRAQWKAEYDIVLIDSRTGLTDSGGICTIQLPDIVVAMFTANYQSLYGVRDVMRLARQSRQKLSFDRMLLNVIPLPSRFGTRSEFVESRRWLDEFAEALGEFFAEWLPSSASPRQVLDRMKIPQVDYFSFGERLAIIEDPSSGSGGMTAPYNMVADLIESDLGNVSTILPPESWQIGSPSESKKVPRQTSDGYRYDIYVSYAHDAQSTSWIKGQFWQHLVVHLKAQSENQLETFFDFQEVRVGSYWRSTIEVALKHSRVCLALLTPGFSRNSWSLAEIETFVKRYHALGGNYRLILPVLLAGDYRSLPPNLENRETADFTDYFRVRSGAQQLEFEFKLRHLAVDLFELIRTAPPFNPDWPVVSPDDVTIPDAQSNPVRL